MQVLRITIKFFTIGILLASNLSFLGNILIKHQNAERKSKIIELLDANHLEERLEESQAENVSEKEVEERVLCSQHYPFYLSIVTTFHVIESTNISSNFLEIVGPPPEHIA